MFTERRSRWVSRTACGLAMLMALSPVGSVWAVETPDDAPPVPPPPVIAPDPGTPNPAPAPSLPAPAPTTPLPAPATPAAPPVASPTGESRNALILPLDVEQTAQAAPREIVTTLPDRIASYLNRHDRMDAVVFYRNSPVVQRALRENRLREALAGAEIPAASYPAIAREYEAGTLISGSVAGYNFDRQTNTVEISLTLDVRNTAPGGQSRLIAVTGRSQPSAVVSAEMALAAEAANDVALRAAAEIAEMSVEAISAPPAPVVAQAPKKRKKRNNSILIVAGVVILMAILASNGSDNDNGNGGGTNVPVPNPGTGGTDNPPAPPPL